MEIYAIVPVIFVSFTYLILTVLGVYVSNIKLFFYVSIPESQEMREKFIINKKHKRKKDLS
jgi:hypothetical protein